MKYLWDIITMVIRYRAVFKESDIQRKELAKVNLHVKYVGDCEYVCIFFSPL